MGRTDKSFGLQQPYCPDCLSDNVRVVKDLGNISRIAAGAVCALIAYPAVSYRCCCRACGREFHASLKDR